MKYMTRVQISVELNNCRLRGLHAARVFQLPNLAHIDLKRAHTHRETGVCFNHDNYTTRDARGWRR